MRELNLTELQVVSGGDNNNGYTFSFIVQNAVTWAVPCFAIGMLTGNVNTMLGLPVIGGSIGASYATVMMITTAIDNRTFTPAAE